MMKLATVAAAGRREGVDGRRWRSPEDSDCVLACLASELNHGARRSRAKCMIAESVDVGAMSTVEVAASDDCCL